MLKLNWTGIYRTKSQFVIGIVLAVFTAIVAIGQIIEFETVAGRVAAAIFLVGGIFVSVRLALAGVRTTDSGIKVVNMFSSYDLSWGDIAHFRIGPKGLFPYVCLIDLRDGGTKHAFGIQERTNFPNGSAERMADELNAELAQRSREGFDGRRRTAGPELGSGGSLAPGSTG